MPAYPDSDRSHHGGAGHDANVEQVYIALVRLDAKFDTQLRVSELRDAAVHRDLSAIKETLSHNAASLSKRADDHEDRLRVIENRRYVEPKTVWQAVGLLMTVAGVALTIINIVTR